VDYFRFADPAWNERAITIPNGIDPVDAPVAKPWQRSRKLRLAYVGTLYGPRNAVPVFDALARAIRAGDIAQDDLEFRAVGNVWLHLSMPPEVRIVETGYLPHTDAIAEMQAADALLLYEPPGSLAMTGKVYEYLATGRPILCVAPEDNRAARLVRELGAGIVADPEDPDAIHAAVLDLHARWRAGELATDERVRATVLERFSRETLTGQLAEVLSAATVRSASTATQ
jgi:glycosyltransferase involved in cell wall biosynthesis